jgi:class 3 adenylate cyclase
VHHAAQRHPVTMTADVGVLRHDVLRDVTRLEPNSRVLASVLFTDIVDSTARACALGDRGWRELLDTHDAVVRRLLDTFRGREISTIGDGFFAIFGSPAPAIRCAQAIMTDTAGVGVTVRAGVHAGECEVRGRDYSGIAVHIGARVAATADGSQVLVTRTVKDIVAGPGIGFVDRGVHWLKGVPEPWHLYEAV